jgi:2-phosphosulfolactate phosphatase
MGSSGSIAPVRTVNRTLFMVASPRQHLEADIPLKSVAVVRQRSRNLRHPAECLCSAGPMTRTLAPMRRIEPGAIFAQDGFSVRFEWGLSGAKALAPGVEVLVIVDVLSFTTAVEVATARGAYVYPYRYRDDSAKEFARCIGAMLAVSRQDISTETPYSLSPASLAAIPASTRLVLPSPNGSAISVLAAELGRPILAGCLRNAAAVAAAARARGNVIGVIASGERWADGSLRPSYEDLVGAGAIMEGLSDGGWSPEAYAALSAFRAAHGNVKGALLDCASARELTALGYSADVQIASELNVSTTVPVFESGAYMRAGQQPTARGNV